ncbi:hypothetical protein D3C71_1402400 [compost metagenome]
MDFQLADVAHTANFGTQDVWLGFTWSNIQSRLIPFQFVSNHLVTSGDHLANGVQCVTILQSVLVGLNDLLNVETTISQSLVTVELVVQSTGNEDGRVLHRDVAGEVGLSQL